MFAAANLVHVGYALMLVALLARDVLWLRSALAAAQTTLTAYAWFTGRPSMAAWNALFVLINTLWALRILRERRAVALPVELAPLHAAHFAALSALEFLQLWALGKVQTAPDGELLVRRGERPLWLHYLLSGTVRVEQDGKLLVRLSAGSFVGEMSLLTAQPANADVKCEGSVQLRAWAVAGLDQLRARKPAQWARIQSVLGRDIVEKIQRATADAPAA